MGQSDLQQNRRVIQTHHEVLVLVLLFLLCPWNHLLSIHLPTHQLTMLTCLDPACTRGTVQHSTTPTYVLAAPSDTRFVSFSPRSYCCWCCWRHCRWCRWQQWWWWCHWCIRFARRGPRPHRETVHLGHHGSSALIRGTFFPDTNEQSYEHLTQQLEECLFHVPVPKSDRLPKVICGT